MSKQTTTTTIVKAIKVVRAGKQSRCNVKAKVNQKGRLHLTLKRYVCYLCIGENPMCGILEGTMEAEHARDIETLSDERGQKQIGSNSKVPHGGLFLMNQFLKKRRAD